MNGEGTKGATAANLKRLRTEKNETQEDTAKAAGVSLSSYKAYENGERIPRDEVKVRLAEHFGTTSQAIFFELNPVGEPTELKQKAQFTACRTGLELSPEEKEFLYTFRQLDEVRQGRILNALYFEHKQQREKVKTELKANLP